MDILDREISNAFNDALHILINDAHRVPSLQEYENVVLRYFKSERCDKLLLAADVLKPKLENKPEWANYAAMVNYGVWLWFEKKPTFNEFGNWIDGGKHQIVNKFNGEDSLIDFTIGETVENPDEVVTLHDKYTYELMTYLNKTCKVQKASKKYDIDNRRMFVNGVEQFITSRLSELSLEKCVLVTEAVEKLVDACWVNSNDLYVVGHYEVFYGRFKQFFETVKIL
jgi:hypothetical protein